MQLKAIINGVHGLLQGEGNPFPEAAIGRGALLVSGTRDGSVFYTYRFGQDRIGSSAYSASLAEGNLSPAEALANRF